MRESFVFGIYGACLLHLIRGSKRPLGNIKFKMFIKVHTIYRFETATEKRVYTYDRIIVFL